MKRRGLVVALAVVGFSGYAVAKKANRYVTFINDDEQSDVTFSIHDKKGVIRKTLGTGESYEFLVKKDIKYGIEARETDEDGLKTGVYKFYLRKDRDRGTIRIVRAKFLIGEDKLDFVGNKEGDADEGAYVQQSILGQPSWATEKEKKSFWSRIF
jgi:hypothetical protein